VVAGDPVAFYGDVMGAEIIRRGAGFAYRFGGVQLNVHGPGIDANLADPGRDHGTASRAQWRESFTVVAGDPVASSSEGRRRCAGQQDGAHRLGSPHEG
jgi:hypothetical protein